jgi:uncharacterized protein involved in outer membrane biogenesis
MRKWMILGAILVVLAGGLALAALNLNSYLNRNKTWLAAQAATALGRPVEFDEIGVSLLGGFGVRVSGLRIADDPRYSKEDFVRAGQVQVLVKILPALFGRVEVRRFRLDRPAVTVIRTAQGMNVASLGQASGVPRAKDTPPSASPNPPQPGERAPAPAAPPTREPGTPTAPADGRAAGGPDGPGASAAPSIVIGAIEIDDGELRYLDRTARGPATGEFVVRHLDLSATDVGLTEAIQLEVAAAIFGVEAQNFSVKGRVGPLGAGGDTARAPVDLAVAFDPLDVDAAQRALPGAAAVLPPGLAILGPLGLRARVSGTVGAPSLSDAVLTADDAAITYADAFTKAKGVPFRLALDVARSERALEIKKLVLTVAEMHLTATGTVATAIPGTVNLDIGLAPVGLGGLGALLPQLAAYDLDGTVEATLHAKGAVGGDGAPQVTGALKLKNVGGGGDGLPRIAGFSPTIELKGNGAVIAPTALTVGGAPLEIGATVESFAKPVIRFTLRSPALPTAALGVEGEDVLRELAVDGTVALGGAAPDLRGAVRSAGGRVQQIDYQDLRVDARVADQVATLDTLAVRAYGGTYRGQGRYDMRNAAAPAFNFESVVEGMDLTGLLGAHFPGAAARIRGRLDADLALTGAGATWDAISSALRGNGKAAVHDGALVGVNIAESVLGGATGVPGLTALVPSKIQGDYPQLFAATDTAFERCGGSIRIADGRVSTEDLALAAIDYQVRGRGWFSFTNEVDFGAVLVTSEPLTRKIIDEVSAAKYVANRDGRIEIPFRFAGQLASAKPKPDLSALARSLQGALIQEGIGKLLGAPPRPGGGAAPAHDGAAGADETRKRKGSGEEKPRPAAPTTAEELLQKGLEGLLGR